MLKPTDEEIASVLETYRTVSKTHNDSAMLTVALSINKLADAVYKRSEIPPEPISKQEFLDMYFAALAETRNIPLLTSDARTERFVMLLYDRICEKIELSRKSQNG